MIYNADTVNLNLFLRKDQQVRVAVYLPDDTIIDLNAEIIRIDNNILQLETFLSNVSQLSSVPIGTRVTVLSSETWAFCRGQGVFTALAPPYFTVTLFGDFDVQQRREFFRMDVFIPVVYSIPENQSISDVEGMWKARRMVNESADPPRAVQWQRSFKIIDWNGYSVILPCRANLSGGGIRLKIAEYLTAGTLVDVDLFVPTSKVKVITGVCSVIRSTEVTLNLDSAASYVTALKFVNLAENDRETIISYIFNEQRNNLRQQSDK